jgi:uncharacterized membrane protein
MAYATTKPVEYPVMSTRTFIIAAAIFAAGGSVSATHAQDSDSAKYTADGGLKCNGANACKGQSACKTAGSSCKAQNACKGQGFTVARSGLECRALGGRVIGGTPYSQS